MGRHFLIRAITLALLVTVSPLSTRPSQAAVGLGGGADFYAGPEGQTNKDVLGFVSAGGSSLAVTGILARYDSSNLGPGVTGSLVLGLPLSGGSFLQFAGTRSVGDEIYRAWRVAFGPVLALQDGTSLGIVFSHTEENVGATFNTFSTEFSGSLGRAVGGVVRGSYSSVEGGGSAYQAVLGLTWAATKRLQVYGELGMGRDVVTTIQGEGAVLTPDAAVETAYLSGPSLSSGFRYTFR